MDVALKHEFMGRELEGAEGGFAVSPARSTNVLRGSPLAGGGIPERRALVADADISWSLLGEEILLGGRIWEGYCNTQCLSVSHNVRYPTYWVFLAVLHDEILLFTEPDASAQGMSSNPHRDDLYIASPTKAQTLKLQE